MGCDTAGQACCRCQGCIYVTLLAGAQPVVTRIGLASWILQVSPDVQRIFRALFRFSVFAHQDARPAVTRTFSHRGNRPILTGTYHQIHSCKAIVQYAKLQKFRVTSD